MDFVAYGERGLFAFEIKRKKNITSGDLKGLQAFGADYKMAKLYLLCGCQAREYHENITVIPFQEALFHLKDILTNQEL